MAQYCNKHLLGLKEMMAKIYENKTFTNNEIGFLHYRLSEYPEKYSENDEFEEILECCCKYINIIVKYSEINNSQFYTSFRTNISRYMSGVTVIQRIPEFVNKFVKEITVPIFEHITDPSIKVICAKELIRTFNVILTSCTKSIREELANSCRIYLYRLADLVCSCGDYEYQTCLLETIFRVCPTYFIKAHAHDFFPGTESLQQALIKFDVKNFDTSVRMFLRIVNSIFGNVYSFVADDVLLDKRNITPPTDSHGQNIELWIDCNKTSSTIGIYCNQTCLRTESLPEGYNEMGWELITIFVDNISLVEVKKPKNTNEVQNSPTLFRFTLINQFHVHYSSSEEMATSKYLKVVIHDSKVTNHLQNAIFPSMFKEKFQGIVNKKSKTSDISSLGHDSNSSKGKYKPLRISKHVTSRSITSMDSRSMKSLDDLMMKNAVNKSRKIVIGANYVSPNSTILDISFGHECIPKTQYLSANEDLDSEKNQEITEELKSCQSCPSSDYDKKPTKKEKIKVKFPFNRKRVSARKSFDPLFSPISESFESNQLEQKDDGPEPSCSKQMEENGEIIVSTPVDINQNKTGKRKRRKEKHSQTTAQKQAVGNETVIKNVQVKTLVDVKKTDQSLNDIEKNFNEVQQGILLRTERNSVEHYDVLNQSCEIAEITVERRSQDNLNQINSEIAISGSNKGICESEILKDCTALWDELDDVMEGTKQEDPATNNTKDSISESSKSLVPAMKLTPAVIQEGGDKNLTQNTSRNTSKNAKLGLKKRVAATIISNELANIQIEKNSEKNCHITDFQELQHSEIIADTIDKFNTEETNKKDTESFTTKDVFKGKKRLLKKKRTQKLCDEKQHSSAEESAQSKEIKTVHRKIVDIAKISAEQNSNLLDECSNNAEIRTEALYSSPSQKTPIIRQQGDDLLCAKTGENLLTQNNDSIFVNENLIRNERKDVPVVQDMKLNIKRKDLKKLRSAQEDSTSTDNTSKSLAIKPALDIRKVPDINLRQNDIVNELANSQIEKSIEKTNEKDERVTYSPPKILVQTIEEASRGHHSDVVDTVYSTIKDISKGKLLKKKETQKSPDEIQLNFEEEYAESKKMSAIASRIARQNSHLQNEFANKLQTRTETLDEISNQKNDSLPIVQQQKDDLLFEREASNLLTDSDDSTCVDEGLLQTLRRNKQEDVVQPLQAENAIADVSKLTIKSEHIIDQARLSDNVNKSEHATRTRNFNDKTRTKVKCSDSDLSSQVISGTKTSQIKQKKKISRMIRSQSSGKNNDVPDVSIEDYDKGTNLEVNQRRSVITRAYTNANSATVSNAVGGGFIAQQNALFDEFLANESTHSKIEPKLKDVEDDLKMDKYPVFTMEQSEKCVELRRSRRKRKSFYISDSYLHDDTKNFKSKRTVRKIKHIYSVQEGTRQKKRSSPKIEENKGSRYEDISKNVEDEAQKTEDVVAIGRKRGRNKAADTQKNSSLSENNNNNTAKVFQSGEVFNSSLALGVDSKIMKNNENEDKDVGTGKTKDIKSAKKNKRRTVRKFQKDERKSVDATIQRESRSKTERKADVDKNCNVLSVAESDNKMEEVIVKDSVVKGGEVDVLLKQTLKLDKSAELKRTAANGSKSKSERASPALNDDKAVKQLTQTELLVKNVYLEEIVCNDSNNDQIENIDAAAVDKDQSQENNKPEKLGEVRNSPDQNVLTYDVNTETVISSSQKSKRNGFKRKFSQSDTKLFVKSKRFKLYDPNDFSYLDDSNEKDLTVISQSNTSQIQPLKALHKTTQQTSTIGSKKSLREKNKIKQKKSTTRPVTRTSGTDQAEDALFNLLNSGPLNISTVPRSQPQNLIKDEIINNSVKKISNKAMPISNGKEETVLEESVDKTNERNLTNINTKQSFQLDNIAQQNVLHKNYEKTMSSSSSSDSDDEPPKRIQVIAMVHSVCEDTYKNSNIIHENTKIECTPKSVDNKKKESKLRQKPTTSKQRTRKRKPAVQKDWNLETTKLDPSRQEIFDTFLGSFADDIDKYMVPVNKRHTRSRLQKRNQEKKAMKVNILQDIILKPPNEEITNERADSNNVAESDGEAWSTDSTFEVLNDGSGSESRLQEVMWKEILKLLLNVKDVLIKTAPASIRYSNEYKIILKHLLAVKKAATKLK